MTIHNDLVDRSNLKNDKVFFGVMPAFPDNLSLVKSEKRSEFKKNAQMREKSTRNDEEVSLLYNDPNALVEKYQNTIEIIVKRFIKSGFFSPGEKKETIQIINEKLLTGRVRNMQARYNGSFYVNTYLSKVIYNLCLEIKRQDKKIEETNLDDIDQGYEDGSPSNKIIIREEFKRFETILKMYHKSRAKLFLCIKLFSRMTLEEMDILSYCPGCNESDKEYLSKQFSGDFSEMTDKEIYAAVTPVFNRCEGKDNSADATRKWFDIKAEEIIEILNGKPPQASYTKETLRTLAQLYFESKLTSSPDQ